MRENEWTRVLGWPGYKVYRHEIDEQAKTLKLWVRRKRGQRQLVCSGCGRLVSVVAQTYEREVRDLPCFEYVTSVVIELYRVRCPDCGVKAEKVPLLLGKAPFSKRFEDAVGQACESSAASRVARQFGLAASTVRAIDPSIHSWQDAIADGHSSWSEFGYVLNEHCDPAVGSILWLQRLTQLAIGIATHLDNLIRPYAAALHQTSGGIGPICRQLPVAVDLRIGIRLGVRMTFN